MTHPGTGPQWTPPPAGVPPIGVQPSAGAPTINTLGARTAAPPWPGPPPNMPQWPGGASLPPPGFTGSPPTPGPARRWTGPTIAVAAAAAAVIAGASVGLTLLFSGGSDHSQSGPSGSTAAAHAPAPAPVGETSPAALVKAYTTAINNRDGRPLGHLVCTDSQFNTPTGQAWTFINLNEHVDAGPVQSTGSAQATVPLAVTFPGGNGTGQYMASLAQQSGRWCVQEVGDGGQDSGAGTGTGSGSGSDSTPVAPPQGGGQ